ncbi:large conductance mechanosensitive channel protein MscL [Paenibacillus taiwanensis]|uniref:large conductance mechanosensitive channel protein MscL n=1 Tax=Paenibacillus taiwanensis TaxID=401638 RepID=UPI000429EFBE|nr:large conductance mechanosensitive channel protein MscL [Paenibacillus taiwanensis]
MYTLESEDKKVGESKVRTLAQEFKQFALRGNVIDLAVGVIIGGAFNKIVTSIVNDLVMPPIGYMLGGVNFKDLFWQMDGKLMPDGSAITSLAQAQQQGAAVIAYGSFVSTIIDFIIIALSIFVMVKAINVMHRKRDKEEVVEEPTTKACPYCVSEIPKAATRCPSCTSMLNESETATV